MRTKRGQGRFCKTAEWRACWTTYHTLGCKAAVLLDANKSFKEIASHFETDDKNIRNECMVALGKVIFAFRQMRDKI